MRSDLTALLDALDLAVASAAELFGTEQLDPIAETARDVRRRVGFLGETVVVALVGGTGSGKSSLLNALAGEQVAATGVIRPTTQQALAWIPAQPEPGLTRLLDDLEITDRVGHSRFEHLAVIDLPDMDSYDDANLAEVKRLVPRIDVVVWVFDPIKYNDRSIHAGFLRRLTDYQDQYLFVLNQADRLKPSEQDEVVNDMWKTLAEDGLDHPDVLVTAAAPEWGDPAGIDEFETALLARVEDKQTVIRKLVADIMGAAGQLEEITGVAGAASVDFRNRWSEVRSRTAANLAGRVVDARVARDLERVGEVKAVEQGAGPLARLVARLRGGVVGRSLGLGSQRLRLPTPTDLVAGGGWLEAVQPVTQLVTDLSVDVGGRLGALIRTEFNPEQLDTTLRDAVIGGQSAAGPPPEPGSRPWWRWAGYVQGGLTSVVVLAVIAALAGWGGVERGSWPVSLLVAAVAIVAGLVVSGVVRASGRASGRRAAEAYRRAVSTELDRTLQRRVGSHLETYLRRRGDLAAALATLRLEGAAAARR